MKKITAIGKRHRSLFQRNDIIASPPEKNRSWQTNVPTHNLTDERNHMKTALTPQDLIF